MRTLAALAALVALAGCGSSDDGGRSPSAAAKAPPAVIEQERKRIADFTAALEKIRVQLQRLGG